MRPYTLDYDKPTAQVLWRRFILATAGGYGATAASLILNLAAVPISLAYFGAGRYGALAIIASLTGFMGLAGVGVPAAVPVLVARSTSKEEELSVLAGSLAIMGAACLAGAGVLALIDRFIDWPAFLHLPRELAHETRRAAWIAAGFALATLPLAAINSAFSGRQLMHIERLYSLAPPAATLAAAVICRLSGFGLPAFVAIQGAAAMAAAVVGCVHLLGRSGILRLVRSASQYLREPKRLRPVATVSWRFFLMGAAARFVWNTDNFVVSYFFGPAAVAAYAVTFRFVTLTFSAFTIFSGSFGPMAGRASALGDWGWIDRNYRRLTLVGPAIAGGIWLAVGAFGKDAITLWAGHEAYAGMGVVMALAGYGWVVSMVHAHSALLTSLNLTERAVPMAWSEGLANLALSVALARLIGLPGVALGTALASGLTVCWMIPAEIRRGTEGRVRFDWSGPVRHALYVLAPALAALAVLSVLPVHRSALAGLQIGLLFAYLAGCWTVLPDSDRAWAFGLTGRGASA